MPDQSISCVTPRGFFAPHLYAVSTPRIISRPCRRPAITLLLAANGKPFQLQLAGRSAVSARAALIAPDQERRLHADGCDLLSINIEPGHRHYRSMRQHFLSAPIRVFHPAHFAGSRGPLRLAYEGGPDAHDTLAAIEVLLDAARDRKAGHAAIDARITEVLLQVHASLPDKLPLASLAAAVGLSADRLSHLFAETVGTPLRSYIVWHRYLLALQKLSGPGNLARLASDCGFADAAHMTRTFLFFFGISPSLAVRSGFVQDLVSAR